jgi:hypothetical protein
MDRVMTRSWALRGRPGGHTEDVSLLCTMRADHPQICKTLVLCALGHILRREKRVSAVTMQHFRCNPFVKCVSGRNVLPLRVPAEPRHQAGSMRKRGTRCLIPSLQLWSAPRLGVLEGLGTSARAVRSRTVGCSLGMGVARTRHSWVSRYCRVRQKLSNSLFFNAFPQNRIIAHLVARVVQ